MSGLEFYTRPGNLAANPGRVMLEIGVCHDFAETLHHLSLWAQPSFNLRVPGTPRLALDMLPPGREEWLRLQVQVLGPGPVRLVLSQISARLNGKTVEFPDWPLELWVRPVAEFPLEQIKLINERSQGLLQGARCQLALTLLNESAHPLRQVKIRLQSNDFDLQEERLAADDLPAAGSRPFTAVVTPRVSGDCQLDIHLSAESLAGALQKTFIVRLPVGPSQAGTTIHNGDAVIIQTGQGLQARVGAIEASTAAGAALPGEIEQATAIRCPGCGQLSTGLYHCHFCGERLPRA